MCGTWRSSLFFQACCRSASVGLTTKTLNEIDANQFHEGRAGGILNDIGAVSTSLNYSNASVLLRVTLDYASVEYGTNIIEYFKAKHLCLTETNPNKSS